MYSSLEAVEVAAVALTLLGTAVLAEAVVAFVF
jgi:hypothetical protein